MKQINFLLSAIFLLCTSTALQAAVVENYNITSINDALTGAQLKGMVVNVNFNDNSSSSATWNGSNIATNGWQLNYQPSNPDNTLSGIWNFLNNTGKSVKSVAFDLMGSNAVFDVLNTGEGPSDPVPGNSTPGSLSGGFSIAGGLAPLQFDYSFTGTVGLNGAVPVGDLFTNLLINNFGKPLPGGGGLLSSGRSFGFIADTDLVVVPLPAAVYLFGNALLGLVGVKRRNTQV